MEDRTVKSSGSSDFLRWAPVVLSIILGPLSVWGTSQFVSGGREQRIETVEVQIKDHKEQLGQCITKNDMGYIIQNWTNQVQAMNDKLDFIIQSKKRQQ